MKDILTQAQARVSSLPLEELQSSGVFLNRLTDNPEAARYFLTYGDWARVTPEEIFADFDAETAEPTQVYVDFPFCPSVCNFCAFYPVLARDDERMAAYVRGLKKEVGLLRRCYFDRGFTADTLELGGGTPTQLPLRLLEEAVTTLLEEFPFRAGGERNVETTPEAVTGEAGLAKLRFLRAAGFNRVSIGAQSFNDEVLRAANRSHTSRQTLEALDNARALGFERINFDLLLGLLDQRIEHFVEAVERCIELEVDIVEVYTMRYFDTKSPVPLTHKFLAHPSRFMPEREILVARVAADMMLREAGYVSSNGRTYYKPTQNYYSQYYKRNFEGGNVLGVGRKSHSNIYPWQYANYRNIDKYSAALEGGTLPIAAGQRISDAGMVAKRLTGALQLDAPVRYSALRGRGAPGVERFDGLLRQFASLGLMAEGGDGYEKTFLGFLFIEEMLKSVYEVAVTPFNVNSEFLGRRQAAKAMSIN